MTALACATCGAPLTRKPTHGRAPEYCTPCLKKRNQDRSRARYLAQRKPPKQKPHVAHKSIPAPMTIIAEGAGLERLAGAVVIQAVRDARKKPDAIEWLNSKASQLYLDVLDIHPDQIDRWKRNGMKGARA